MNIVALDDAMLLEQYASVCKHIGMTYQSGYTPKALLLDQKNIRNEILRRLNDRIIKTDKEN